MAIAAVVVLRWFTIRLTRPLLQMTSAAEAMAGGDFSQPVAVERGDEIGRLGRAFNLMRGEVAAARRDLELRVRERTEELNAALAQRRLHRRAERNGQGIVVHRISAAH